MNQNDLFDLLRNGENSGVEFKRDDVEPRALAKEIVALANLRGGRVLLGVEDDGSISGIQRPDLEEWVMTVCRDKIRPEIIPYFETVRDDSGWFIPAYTEAEIIKKNPFASIDQAGVGQLMKIAVEKGRQTRPDIKLGPAGAQARQPQPTKRPTRLPSCAGTTVWNGAKRVECACFSTAFQTLRDPAAAWATTTRHQVHRPSHWADGDRR